MKYATIYNYFTNKEEQVNVFEAVGLSKGSLVTHNNEGKTAGSHGIIRVGTGEILDIDYAGEYSWGGHAFIAKVKWSNGETFTLNTNLLTKI